MLAPRPNLSVRTLAMSVGAAAISHGAITSSNVVNDSSTFFDTLIATTPSLMTAGQPSLSSVVSTPVQSPFLQSGLNDLVATAAGAGDTWYFQNGGTMPATITITLTGGYDITSIRSIAGWGNTGSDGAFFGSQQFALYLATGGSGTFVNYGNFGMSAFLGTDVADDSFATMVTVSDTAGPIATNVTGIRFVFTDPYPGVGIPNHGTVLRELAVFGTATVPEPAPCGLLGLGALSFLLRRRR